MSDNVYNMAGSRDGTVKGADMEPETRIGHVEGWKELQYSGVKHGQAFVKSSHAGLWWSPFEDAHAKCERADGIPDELKALTDAFVPSADCSCGIYAMKARVEPEARGSYGQVTAKLALYGKVIEHENGYRAEYARILELIVPNEAWKQALAWYNVPIAVEPMPERVGGWASGTIPATAIASGNVFTMFTTSPQTFDIVQDDTKGSDPSKSEKLSKKRSISPWIYLHAVSRSQLRRSLSLRLKSLLRSK